MAAAGVDDTDWTGPPGCAGAGSGDLLGQSRGGSVGSGRDVRGAPGRGCWDVARASDHGHSNEVLAGLVSSTSDLVAAITVELIGAWGRRRDDPALIIQPGKQWNLETGDSLGFPGYGQEPRTAANTMRVHPTYAKRLTAAKVLNGHEGFWTSS